MTYLATICLALLVGGLVPYIVFMGLIVRPLQERKRYQESNKKSKIKFGEVVFGIFFIGFIIGMMALTWWNALPLCLDIPSLITRNYEIDKGEITDINYENDSSGSKTWGFDNIEVDNERYSSEDLDFPRIGEEIKIYYLKHSQYIVKAKSDDGDFIVHTFSKTKFLISLLISMVLIGFTYCKLLRGRKQSPTQVATSISFCVFTLLILILEGFDTTGKVTSFAVIMLTNFMFHFLQFVGGVKKNIG